jgi:transcriptional antiterminator
MNVRIIIRLDQLIINEMTGSPKQLASKLGITERSVYNYISFMKKEMNAPIKYDYQIQSYVYCDDWEFKLSNSK